MRTNQKLIFTAVMSLCLCALMVGCGNSGNSESEKTENSVTEQSVAESEENESSEISEESEVPTSFVITELSDNLFDYQISFDGEILSLPCALNDLHNMGWEYEETYILSSGSKKELEMMKDDKQITVELFNTGDEQIAIDQYEYESFSSVMVNNIMVSVSESWNTGDFEIKTAKGITEMVSTVDDVVAAYGEPAYIKSAAGMNFYYYYENPEEYKDLQSNEYWLSADNAPDYIYFRFGAKNDDGNTVVDSIQIKRKN